jgi:hypothetical protein
VPSSPKPGRRWTCWDWCAAILLVGLLLYNPFQAATTHADGLAYQTLARHRATVGASELQHLASTQGDKLQPEVVVERVFTELQVQHQAYPADVVQEETLPQRPDLTLGVWFRPPPAA